MSRRISMQIFSSRLYSECMTECQQFNKPFCLLSEKQQNLFLSPLTCRLSNKRRLVSLCKIESLEHLYIWMGLTTYSSNKMLFFLENYLAIMSLHEGSSLCRVEYGHRGVGVVSQQLYTSLTSLQMGQTEDWMGWTVQLN